jgi:hypothetical protein
VAWRWDQGHLPYFQFDNVRAIAGALAPLDGVSLRNGDPLKAPLTSATGLAFAAPGTHSVWRNYGRALQVALLATEVSGRLKITQVCSGLAGGGPGIGSDDYFSILATRFRLPFPAFADYDPRVAPTYPFCAVIRFLLSRASTSRPPQADLDEIFSYVVGNRCSGREPISSYAALRSTAYSASADEKRQVREMLIVLSQFSVLNWHSGTLFLDFDPAETSALADLERLAIPAAIHPLPDRRSDLISLGALGGAAPSPPVPPREAAGDQEFTEGKRVRVTHLRTERNRSLRKQFFRSQAPPYSCACCRVSVNARYPWVENLLEVHHVLPLSSPARIGATGTKLIDLVALCPNCHHAVHDFYRRYLDRLARDDFADDNEARLAFAQARAGFVP